MAKIIQKLPFIFNQEKLRTAYHEAGHAILILNKDNKNSVFQSIIFDPEINGQITATTKIAPNSNKAVFSHSKEIQILLAGKLTENLFLKATTPRNYGLKDLKQALTQTNFLINDESLQKWHCADNALVKEKNVILQEQADETIKILKDNKREIELIANNGYFLNGVSFENAAHIMRHKELPKNVKNEISKYQISDSEIKKIHTARIQTEDSRLSLATIFQEEIKFIAQEEQNLKAREEWVFL